MRIHSDTLTTHDLWHALDDAGLSSEVWIEHYSVHGSRSRDLAFEVRLAAEPGEDRHGKKRRPRNSGTYGAESFYGTEIKAATFDEWGYWIGELFARDPDAIVGSYTGAVAFSELFEGKYDA